MIGQVEAVGAKRVGLDDVRPGVDIVTMDAGDDARVGDIDRIERLINGHPFAMQHRAKSAV